MSRMSKPMHQVLDHLREGIAQGRWAVGAPLPPVRALADQFGVSVNTVLRSLERLEGQGLVVCRPRQGAFVSSQDSGQDKPAARTGLQVGVISGLDNADMASDARDSNFQVSWGLQILHALREKLHEQGCQISLLSYTSAQHAPLEPLVHSIDQIGQDLAGVVCYPGCLGDELFTELDRRDIPWVTLNRRHEKAVYNFVGADNVTNGRAVGRCFAIMGFERVLVLQHSVQESIGFFERVAGFYQGYMLENRTTRGVELLDCPTWEEPGGYLPVREHLKSHPAPQAIYAAGDLMALGAIRACLEAGLRVPDDVKVIGASGLEVGRYFQVPLTSISQPMRQMGHDLGNMLLEMVREGTRRLVGRQIPGQLLVRDSFVPPASLHDRLGVDVVDERPLYGPGLMSPPAGGG